MEIILLDENAWKIILLKANKCKIILLDKKLMEDYLPG